MRILDKQELEKDIQLLFRKLQAEAGQELTDERFNQELAELFARKELLIDASEQRFVSILIADLRGFTNLVEKVPPHKITQILNDYLSTMVEIIDRYGGHVNKFMGDSVIAFFDSSRDDQESVLKVLRCAIDMQMAMDEVNQRGAAMGLDSLYMGIGINTGDVVASVLGSDIYREYTMIGANVNVASRIEGYTLRGQVLISENTWHYVSESIETGPINEVSAKGMRDVLRFYELMAITSPVRMELPKRESRKAPRINIRVPVVYQLLEGKNILPEIHAGEILDISYGGMLINTSNLINPFVDLKLRVTLSPFSNEPADIYAKALYVQHKDRGAEVGLEFTIIDDATSGTVKKFVDSLI